MQYLDCPRCHASFRTGVIYAPLEACPRCGHALNEPRPTRGIFARRRVDSEAPDWESITSSQYARRRVTQPGPDDGGMPGPV
jgi:hypothetical protein